MEPPEIEWRVGIILRQARGTVQIKRLPHATYAPLPPAADDHAFDAQSRVVDSKDLAEAASEQLDLLRVVYSAVPDALKPVFWKAMAAGLSPDSAHVIAHAIVELGSLEQLSKLVAGIPIGAPVLEYLWNGMRSKICFQPWFFGEEGLPVIESAALLTTKTKLLWTERGGRSITHHSRILREVTATIAVIDRVRYLRLRNELLSSENPELNTDRRELISRAESLGFSKEIAVALEEIDKRIRASATPLDFKTCMDLLRSVLEKIVQEAARRTESKAGSPSPRAGAGVSSFSPFKQYLQNIGLLSADEAEVLQKVYNYLSNAGAHSLASAPEQARVAKNTVIEWTLLLLGRVQEFV